MSDNLSGLMIKAECVNDLSKLDFMSVRLDASQDEMREYFRYYSVSELLREYN